MKIPTELLEQPFQAFNADGTKNGRNMVTQYVKLGINIGGHQENIEPVVTQLQSVDIFLGHDWLVQHNSKIDWKEGQTTSFSSNHHHQTTFLAACIFLASYIWFYWLSSI
jgi:hypothetical protein